MLGKIGIVEKAILKPAFTDSEIETRDLFSITKNLQHVKSEDGVKIAIYLGITLSRTNEWLQFDGLLERIDDLLDDLKVDNFLEKRNQQKL